MGVGKVVEGWMGEDGGGGKVRVVRWMMGEARLWVGKFGLARLWEVGG